jgi:hypothetical protein
VTSRDTHKLIQTSILIHIKRKDWLLGHPEIDIKFCVLRYVLITCPMPGDNNRTEVPSIQCPCLPAHIYLVVYKTLLLLLLLLLPCCVENIIIITLSASIKQYIYIYIYIYILSRDVNCNTTHLTMTDASGWPELQWRQLNPFRLQTTCCCLHI